MTDLRIGLERASLAAQIGELVRDARQLAGWSQAELAARARTSQSMISRIETARAAVLDVRVLERILVALGMQGALRVEGRHLLDRRRQADAVHARVNGYIGGHLARRGFRTAAEVGIGESAPRGWIDLLAYRSADRAVVVNETKGDLPDVGGFQRHLAMYAREARAVANGLGWRPTRVVVLGSLLDSRAVRDRVAANRQTLASGFPSPVDRFLAWADDPAAPAPFGWTLAACDPASRTAAWLRPVLPGAHRRHPAYEDYADAATRLGGNRSRRRSP